MNRRRLLQGMAGTLALGALPGAGAGGLPTKVDEAVKSLYGERRITPERVRVKLPKLSENGNSVPMTIEVESPMTATEHVARISVFAEANPLPQVANFALGARAGLARVETRIRLADSQHILAIAEMNDGSLWSGNAFTLVTLAACVI